MVVFPRSSITVLLSPSSMAELLDKKLPMPMQKATARPTTRPVTAPCHKVKKESVSVSEQFSQSNSTTLTLHYTHMHTWLTALYTLGTDTAFHTLHSTPPPHKPDTHHTPFQLYDNDKTRYTCRPMEMHYTSSCVEYLLCCWLMRRRGPDRRGPRVGLRPFQRYWWQPFRKSISEWLFPWIQATWVD